jgi:hypothetical protein
VGGVGGAAEEQRVEVQRGGDALEQLHQGRGRLVAGGGAVEQLLKLLGAGAQRGRGSIGGLGQRAGAQEDASRRPGDRLGEAHRREFEVAA